MQAQKRQKIDETVHLVTQNPECKECSQEFTTKRALKRHLRETRRHRPIPLDLTHQIICPVCEKHFTRTFDRDRHCKEQHGIEKFLYLESSKYVQSSLRRKRDRGSTCDGFASSNSLEAKIAWTETHWSDSSSKTEQLPISPLDEDCMEALRESLAQVSIGRSALVCAAQYKSQIRTAKPRRAEACGFCRRFFEVHDVRKLYQHLKDHLHGSLHPAHTCDTCKIAFVHKADLEKHLRSAARGSCGFNFLHAEPCLGHHPPNVFGCDDFELTEPKDRKCFRYTIRSWELSQLRAYKESFDQLMQCESFQAVNMSGGMMDLQFCVNESCLKCRYLESSLLCSEREC